MILDYLSESGTKQKLIYLASNPNPWIKTTMLPDSHSGDLEIRFNLR